MSNTTVTQLYSRLSDKLGGNTAEDVISFINQKTDDILEHKLANLPTKQELKEFQTDVRNEFIDVRQEANKLRVDMGSIRADLIKWMFLFWVSQMAATIGIVLACSRK